MLLFYFWIIDQVIAPARRHALISLRAKITSRIVRLGRQIPHMRLLRCRAYCFSFSL